MGIIWVTHERSKARDRDGSAFSVNIVTDVLSQGTPQLVHDDECILFCGLFLFIDRCFLFLTEVTTHFPDVVPKFDRVIAANATEIWQSLRLIERLLND